MAHLPLHGLQTKAQRLSSLAHEVSLADGNSAWIYRLTESVQPLPQTRSGRLRNFPEPHEASSPELRSSRPGQV
jgi:hypothetical protein